MSRRVLGCLVVLGLSVGGLATLVVWNWDSVSGNLGEAWAEQAERTQVTLFRLGELMSLAVELKGEFGVEPEVTYKTGRGDRVLIIAFTNYPLPPGVEARAHAREVSAFAIGKTKKIDEIDAVEVRFGVSAERGVVKTGGWKSHRFAIDELIAPPSQ